MQDDSPTTPWATTRESVDDRAAAGTSASTSADVPRDVAASGPSGPEICPFLRSIDDRDVLDAPIDAPDAANRCTALQDIVPQSLRQQELVCLTSGHVNCPRFMRGAPESVQAPEQVEAIKLTTPAIAGSLVLLAVSFVLSIAFVMNNGGLVLTAAEASSEPTGGALGDIESASPSVPLTPTPAPSQTATVTPTETPGTSPSPSPSPGPTVSAIPSGASPSPSATPTTRPSKAPASDRSALLTPCPDQPKCFIYVIRSGDNLFSIAKYFGVPLATVKTMNPWTADGLRAGRELRIPPPTR